MHIFTYHTSQTVTHYANIAIANKEEVAYILYIDIFTFELGQF